MFLPTLVHLIHLNPQKIHTLNKTVNLMCYLQTNRFTFHSSHNPFTASAVLWDICGYYLDHYLSEKAIEVKFDSEEILAQQSAHGSVPEL